MQARAAFLNVRSMIEVQVVLAWPAEQMIQSLSLPESATVADALAAANIAKDSTAGEAASFKVGIFGRLVELDQPLNDGDRVELYRPLIADPKSSRRRRVAIERRRR
jgi:putative ubiquitin-RnfH superfamily antitoxin RatB of RatAB toxin-antitoxin module